MAQTGMGGRGRRPLRPDPENGWVDWEWLGHGGSTGAEPRLDLSAGRLVAGSQRRSGTARGSQADTPPDRSGDAQGVALSEPGWIGVGLWRVDPALLRVEAPEVSVGLGSLHGGLRVLWPVDGEDLSGLDVLRRALGEQARWLGMWDGTRRVGQWTLGRFDGELPPIPGGELLVPWVPGLWRASELAGLGSWAMDQGADAVIPLAIAGSPKQLRELVDWTGVSEARGLRLFLQDGASGEGQSELAEHRAALAETGVRSWFERCPAHPRPRLEWVRRVSGCLGLLALLGAGIRSTGFVEGHRQAARRLEVEQVDVRDLLAEGNLRLLDWLDRRVRHTLMEWFASSSELNGEPPELERMRARIGSAA